MQYILMCLFFLCFSPIEAGSFKNPIMPQKDYPHSVGICPYRKGGVRIEREKYGSKDIIHAYGHGACGVTLSWGTAHKVLDLVAATRKKEIAVIGAGVIGLSVAHVLSDQGYIVSVYAEAFPPNTTSDRAYGLFRTDLFDYGKTKEITMRSSEIVEDSYRIFSDLAVSHAPSFYGVSPLSLSIKGSLEIPKCLQLEPQNIHIGKGRIKGQFMRSISIDMPKYMKDLYEQAKKKGICFVQAKFDRKEELLSRIVEKVICNCTGYGAKKLFRDQDLVAFLGHVTQLPKVENMKDGLLVVDDKNTFSLIPFKDRIDLLGPFIVGEKMEKEAYNQHIRAVENFFNGAT